MTATKTKKAPTIGDGFGGARDERLLSAGDVYENSPHFTSDKVSLQATKSTHNIIKRSGVRLVMMGKHYYLDVKRDHLGRLQLANGRSVA